MKPILLFILLLQFPHDFTNKEGERKCKFCHASHNSKGPYLINLIPFDELKDNFKGFDYVSLTCMNCHTDKKYLLILYPEVEKFYRIPDTSEIFLGKEYDKTHHPVGEFVSESGERLIKCTTCHDPHRKKFKYLLKKPLYELCKKCHRIYTNKESHSGLNCLNCHKLHKSRAEPLVKKNDICMDCHTETFSIIEGHRADKKCITCHNPHNP